MITAPATRYRFHLPVRLITCPATVDDTSRPRIIGRLIRPATVGDLPREIWKYCERKTVPPNMATPTRRLATVVRVTVRFLKMPSGITGSGVRDSTNTAATSSSTPPPVRAPVCQDAQSNSLPASDTQISRAQTPATIRNAPSQSMRASRFTVGRRRVRCSRAMAAARTARR
ncbi:hypothetical protein SVIOM342S_05775 [Streptomyces violaceorubidus]